jgi:hypothetical protein
MIMRYLCVLFFFSLSLTVKAQHCGFDSEAILMIRPIDAFLVDSATGLPLLTSDNDSVIFYRNVPPPAGNTDRSFWISKEISQRFRQQYGFYFGVDNYLVTFYFGTTSDRGVKLRIEDTRTDRKEGPYKTVSLALPRQKCFPLCTNNDWSIIKPMQISLAQ